ncbi:MAG: proton-conducting transporter membrane subunit [Patescibacteria group bacterium]
MSFLVQNALLGSLIFTVLSGVIALGGRSLLFHKLAQVLLVVSGTLGIVASFILFLQPQAVLQISLASSFFPILQLDLFGAIFYALISLVSVLCAIYAIPYLQSYQSTYHLRSLNALVAAFVLGMQIVILSTSPFMFMIAWEVMSMASFFLVMSDRSHDSIRAALLYLIMTHLGAAAILIAFLLLAQGSLFVDFSTLADMSWTAPVWMLWTAFSLFFFGFGSKAGLVPFHVWLPEAHPSAPSHVSALMSGVMLKVALYGFLRVLLFILPPIGVAASLLILGFGLLTALYGVLYAVVDRDFKRTLAFSSIENIGLIFTMLGVAFFASSQGLQALYQTTLVAAVFFMIAHAIFKSGLFLASGLIVRAVHSRNLELMGGLAKRLPLFSVLFCVLCLAAASLPPFGPFFGEWMFFQGLLQSFSSATPLVSAVLVLTFAITALVGGLAIFAMVKLFAISMLAEPRSAHAREVHEPPAASELFCVTVFALLIVALGLYAPVVLDLIGGGILTASRFELIVGNSTVQPSLILWLLLGCVLIVWILRRLTSRASFERMYHGWDCGQPIDASMEYTATAFSAPIRFFFRLVLRTKKAVQVEPVVASNTWIATRSMTLNLRSIWMDFGYSPLGRLLIGCADQVKKIQNGNIRFYLLLIFVTLILTLWIAL